MSPARFAIVWILAVAGCADSRELASVDAGEQIDESADVTRAVAPPSEGEDFCDELPATGPCSLACDPYALAAQYVPEGTCVAFACTLDDGREVTIHACHAPH